MSPFFQILSWHMLLWLIPTGFGILLAGLGSRIPRRWMLVLSVAGIGWPLLQAAVAMVVLLWGPSLATATRFEFDWMTGGGMFSLAFMLDATGCWAVLLTATIALAAQVHALVSLARFSGRHRYHALVLVLAGAGSFFFTARSPAAILIGWEGLALAGAFLYAFWESEQKGERAGARWLLFQRLSGLLLLLGFLSMYLRPDMGVLMVLAAACVRAGQLPFHGWVPGSTHGPVSTNALVHGVGSALPAVFLIDRFWPLIAEASFATEVVGAVGVAGVILGMLAGIQQREPHKILGWLFLLQGGLAFLGFAAGDPVASRILVSGEVLTLGGMALAVGPSEDPRSGIDLVGKKAPDLSDRRAFLVLALAWSLPPSLGFLGLGRLLGSIAEDTVGLLLRVVVCLGTLTVGWILERIYRVLEPEKLLRPGSAWSLLSAAPSGLGVVAVVLGVAGLLAKGPVVAGGMLGLVWAVLATGSMALGWVFGWLFSRKRLGPRTGRLTYTQQVMDRVAETGLGVGEFVVQLPLWIARALGVVLWRGVGDLVLDTLILGLAVRTVEGVGTALRYIQNGRIQRYTLVVVLGTLLLVIIMLR